MNRNSLFHRITALALTAALAVSSAQAAFLSNSFSYTYDIGENATYTRIDSTSAAGWQKSNIVTYTPGDGVQAMGVMAGSTFLNNRKTLSAAAEDLENAGYDVIAGVNADFFSTTNAVPTGVFVDEGRLVASNNWQDAVGWLEDGTCIIGTPVTTITLSGASGSTTVFDFNKTRGSHGLYLFDEYYASETGFSKEGTSLILEPVSNEDLRIGVPFQLRVTAKATGNYSIGLEPGKYVLSMSADCTEGKWVDYQIGETVTLTFNTTDSRWSDVEYAVGGKTLVRNGAAKPTSIDRATSHCARTAIGVKENGDVVIYQIDGEQSNYSAGATANELAEEMIRLGCVQAVCLDGGGSSVMTVQRAGRESTSRASQPAGGERKVSNFIFLVNTAKSDGKAKYLTIDPPLRYALPGAPVQLTVSAADSGFIPVDVPDDLEFDVVAGGGSVDKDGVYISGKSSGTATIHAEAGRAEGETSLLLVPDLNTITVSKNGTAVSSFSIKPEESVDLDASGSYHGRGVVCSDELFTWSVSGNVGTIDENGVFTASKAGSGTITVAYGSCKKTVSVSVGTGSAPDLNTVATFEEEQPFSPSYGVKLTPTESSDAARGFHALRIDHEGVGEFYVPAVEIGGLRTLFMWCKSDTAIDLRAAYITEDYDIGYIDPVVVPGTDYTFVTYVFPEDAYQFFGFALTADEPGSIWVDHLQLSKTAPLSGSNPVITVQSAPETVAAGASATVTAKITQEGGTYSVHAANVTVSLDGKSVSPSYSESTGILTVNTGALKQGLHTIVITAADDAGNLTRKTVSIKSGDTTAVSFADTKGNWASAHIDALYSRGVLNGSVVGNQRYYYPNNNLTRMEFAVILAGALGLDTSSVGELPFADASKIPNWAKASVSAVYEAGLMTGSTSGGQYYFNPAANITRAETMAVIARLLPQGYAAKSVTFSDSASIPNWAKSAVQTVVSAGLVGGFTDGTIRPLNKITRAEIAYIFCNL